ncbi:ATP-dependent helicase [Aeromicrobium sp. CFBP 8757]|uniref:ATP-dependent helicase n=1 Tax=Aeromicrobium sp. CFBP 8757 TaxID=2775288 RepID=UPI00178592AC|nr:ATP-dependent DNA helicase [Aeromicrobium sp. CFBP 8757]MBD8605340.1 ATP-dependent helicase [Aeromicrobium sp. CFBP 8757]
MPIEYVLRTPDVEPAHVPTLDAEQRAVVDHPGGPLLVLAGPGAGKTSTLVEVVADRVDRGLAPDEILVLTFSRKAADELKSRIARRLARTTASTPAMTFHSFCYALVRQLQDPDDFVRPLQLLSAPEQDAVIQRLLAEGDAEEWPAIIRPSLRTRGLAAEMQRLLSTARGRDMDALDLLRLGESTGREEWKAAARFFDDYTGVAALQNTIDYSDLVFQAVQMLRDPARRDRVRAAYRLVVVDEYQDTDPLQVELLRALAGDGRDVIVVGDPYQSIYGFRGADVRGILDFRTQFPRPDGSPADLVVLSRTSRYGATISAAAASIVSNRGVLGAVDGPDFDGLRHLTPRRHLDGDVHVETFATPTAEAEHIALILREQRLAREVPWGQMAVLVRSGADIARYQRSLSAAGVPVVVAGDELPLASEPSVRSLLAALRAADDIAHDRPLDPAAADSLLSGPLCGLDAPALRRVGRALRTADRTDERGPRASRLLLAEALGQPAVLLTLARPDEPLGHSAAKASRLASLLRRAADQILAGESAERVLWTLWSGTPWRDRLRAEALGDGEGSARADHDLDVLVALFAQAARAEEQQQRRGLATFVAELEAQQIPADTLAQGAIAPDAVQLMTAHRSKGLEWRTVVVAGVQDGTWPDVRHRGSFLRAERLGPHGEVSPPTAREALREERRLFYVACTRARQHLVVTAVESGREDGDQPSLFVSELWDHLHRHADGSVPERQPRRRPDRPLSLRGSIAALRRLGETTDSDVVRDRVARSLALLAERPGGATRPARPERWWGMAAITRSELPMRDPEATIRLSGSSVSSIVECPLKWFYDHEVKASTATTTAQGFGSVVHAVAAEVAEQRLPADAEALGVYVDSVWDQLAFAADWIGGRERAEARDALVRFVSWHLQHGRTTLAAEHEFSVTTTIDGREVTLGGSMDRVEIDADGVHVVDLKTSKSVADRKDLAEHPQLGFYQLAVDLGATSELAEGIRAAGAELVQLRNGEKKLPDYPVVQPQDAPPADQPFFALEQLTRSVHVIADESFDATPSEKSCRYCEFQRACPAQPEGASILGGGQP